MMTNLKRERRLVGRHLGEGKQTKGCVVEGVVMVKRSARKGPG